MEYPLVETAPKDGSPIWAGDRFMVLGRPYQWSEEKQRWLCWFGKEEGFVPVCGEPIRWCPSLTKFAGEVASGERSMPFATEIRKPSLVYQMVS